MLDTIRRNPIDLKSLYILYKKLKGFILIILVEKIFTKNIIKNKIKSFDKYQSGSTENQKDNPEK